MAGEAGEAGFHTFYYEETTPSGDVITHAVRAGIGELSMIRDEEVRSSTIDPKQIERAVGVAESILSSLQGNA